MKRLIIFILTLVSAASAAAPVISSIAVNNVTSTCITWTWTTDVPADSLVGYSPTGNYYDRDAGVKDAWGVTSHSYQVCGLRPSSQVMYLIRSRNVATGEAAFVGSESLTPASVTTAPAPTDGAIDWYFDLYGQHQITQGYDGYLAWRSGLLAGTLVNWTWKVIVSGLPPYTEIHWPDGEDFGAPVRYTTTTIPRDTYYDEWGMARAARVRLVTNVGGVTPPGSYTLSFHTEANGGSLVTKTFTWPLTVVAPTSIQGQAQSFPAIPCLGAGAQHLDGTVCASNWEGTMVTYGQHWCDKPQDMVANYTGTWFYDGERVFYQVKDYDAQKGLTGNPGQWDACSQASERVYRDTGTAGGAVIPNGGMMEGLSNFALGLYTDWMRTGDATSRDAALLLQKTWNLGINGNPLDVRVMREMSYYLDTHLIAHKLGVDNTVTVKQAVGALLAQIDQVASGDGTGDSVHEPFMTGLLSDALIRAYEDPQSPVYHDARIPVALKTLADYLWAHDWSVPTYRTGAFVYQSYEQLIGLPDYYDNRELNMLIAPLYAWLYQQTGDSTYQVRGDAIWDQYWQMNVPAGIGWDGKIFSQSYRWSFDYVRWRSGPGNSPAPAVLTGVQLNPATVVGNITTAQNLVVLSAAAPSSVTISLSSSNPAAASVPAVVVVPAGATSAAFPITISSVAADTNVIISASVAGATQAASLSIKAPAVALAAFTISPASLSAGGNALATVTLTGAAPPNGAAISITNSQPAVVATPSAITIQAGSTSGTFSVTAASLAAANSATISVSYAGAAKSTTVAVSASTPVAAPALSVNSLLLSPATVAAGAQATGTLTLSAAAPAGGATVVISNSNGAAASAPQSVTIPAGSTIANFIITAGSPAVSTTVPVTVTYSGSSQTASLTVTPAPAPAGAAATAAPSTSPSYSLSAPATATPGSTIVVTWTAPAGHASNDFLALCSDVLGSFLPTIGPGTSGSVNVQLPATPGKYFIRYYVGSVWAIAAQTPYIVVQ